MFLVAGRVLSEREPHNPLLALYTFLQGLVLDRLENGCTIKR